MNFYFLFSALIPFLLITSSSVINGADTSDFRVWSGMKMWYSMHKAGKHSELRVQLLGGLRVPLRLEFLYTFDKPVGKYLCFKFYEHMFSEMEYTPIPEVYDPLKSIMIKPEHFNMICRISGHESGENRHGFINLIMNVSIRRILLLNLVISSRKLSNTISILYNRPGRKI